MKKLTITAYTGGLKELIKDLTRLKIKYVINVNPLETTIHFDMKEYNSEQKTAILGLLGDMI
mgnify:CR=1 FL=1